MHRRIHEELNRETRVKEPMKSAAKRCIAESTRSSSDQELDEAARVEQPMKSPAKRCTAKAMRNRPSGARRGAHEELGEEVHRRVHEELNQAARVPEPTRARRTAEPMRNALKRSTPESSADAKPTRSLKTRSSVRRRASRSP